MFSFVSIFLGPLFINGLQGVIMESKYYGGPSYGQSSTCVCVCMCTFLCE